MNKKEFISRYGEEAYKEHRRKMRVNKRRKKMGLPSLKKSEPVNNITVKVCSEIDADMNIVDRLEEQERIAAKLQRRLISWWKSQTDKPNRFILVCDYSNANLSKNTICYKIELTQLNLDEETIAKFTEGVKTKVREFLDEYERDL